VGFSIVTAFVTAGFSPISVPVVAIWAEVDWGIWTIETWEEGLLPAIFAPLTIFVALHVANGAAWVTARITEGLLQPWSTPTARAGTAAPAPPQGTPGSTPEAATHVVPPVAEQAPDHAAAPAMATGPDGAMVPLAERARRTAATITDRVQAVTDDLGERARAAARGWSAASTASGAATADSAPAPEATTPQAPATDTAGHEPPEPGDDERVDGEQEDTGEPARVTVDVVMRIVTVNDEEIELTPKEFDLIVLFVSNPGRPFSRDELLDRIWRNDYEVTDRTIDTHIQRLRKKLGPGAELIQTIWGVGYKYQPPREQA
jgi:DNA-binding winged helix-turn-helix (wHTH) protein